MLSRSDAVRNMDWCKSCRAGTGNLAWPEIGGVALAAWLTDIWSDRTTLTIWYHPRYSSLFFSNGRACKRFFWLLSEVLQEETGQLYCPFSNKWTQWPKRVVIIGLRGNSVKSFPPWSFTSMLSVHHDLNSELPVRNLGYTWYWLFPDHDFGDTSSPFHAISKIPTIRSIDWYWLNFIHFLLDLQLFQSCSVKVDIVEWRPREGRKGGPGSGFTAETQFDVACPVWWFIHLNLPDNHDWHWVVSATFQSFPCSFQFSLDPRYAAIQEWNRAPGKLSLAQLRWWGLLV